MDPVKIITALIGFFVPPDLGILEHLQIDDPKKREELERTMKNLHWWYIKVAGTLTILVAFAGWSLTPGGFTWAEDVKEAISKSETTSQTILEAVNELRAADVAENICRLVRKRSLETDHSERVSLRKDIDKEQSKYRLWTKEGKNYDEASCGS